MKHEQLGLQIDSPLVHPGANNFRPPMWPPPPDWSPILDSKGVAQCVYSDSIWPLDVWAGKPLKLNLGDGQTQRSGGRTDKPNADLLRHCTAWFLFGRRGCRTAGALYSKIHTIKPIFVVCSKERIVATDLMRFPKVTDKVAQALAPSSFRHAITCLHELLDARDDLGFCLFDKDGLARLATLAPEHETEQTPYIPPRIWSYQVSRLRECLADYLAHREQVEACFQFCLDAYAKNFGSMKRAVNSRSDSSRSPFQSPKHKCKGSVYHGSFSQTAGRFGVDGLIEQWIGAFTGDKGEKQITRFSQYLDLVSKAGLAYLLNFSLMRIEEGWNLHSDSLIVEKDEKFGDIHMLRGETTKTDPDNDARWPTSKSSELAIEAMTHIAGLRMRCAKERDGIGLTPADQASPYLIAFQYEPWGMGKSKSYRVRPANMNYATLTDKFPLLFDVKELTITEEDMRIARLITPSLNQDEFKVGGQWKFAWHQLRRTGAVNMLSSDMVDEPSLQLLLKHQSRVMTLYYGRNHSRLNLSQETRTIFLKTMYQEFGRELRKLQSPKFVSPLGPERKAAIVHFIKETETAALDKAARQGKIGARRIRAGFCVKNRSCPYGGHEAIAHCLGGDNGKGCPDLLVDIKKEPDIRAYEELIDDQLRVVHPDSPRHNRLQAEKRAIAKYYEITATQNG